MKRPSLWDWLTPAIALGAAAALLPHGSRLTEVEQLGKGDWTPLLSLPFLGLLLFHICRRDFVSRKEALAVGAAALTCCLVRWGWTQGSPGGAGLDMMLFWGPVLGYLAGRVLTATRAVEGAGENEPARAAQAAPARPWVVLPTYNEIQNIRSMVQEIRAVEPSATVLVVDDNSPDGTAGAVEELGRQDPGIRLLLRTEKRGLDGAWLAGFQAAIDGGADAVVTMDADRSHDPRDLPRLLERLCEADVVIGSRYVPGGRTEGWPLKRQVLSKMANTYARYTLELDQRDCSSGFRAYRSEGLAKLMDGVGEGAGYALLEVLLFRASKLALRIAEVPIVFRERQLGASKMTMKEAIHGAASLWKLRSYPVPAAGSA